MFTGLVEAIGIVTQLQHNGSSVRLHLRSETAFSDAQIGDSVAINGCCLTIVEQLNDEAAFDAGAETLSRTNLGQFAPGTAVNLERSLRTGDRLGGHYVTGHIDCVGQLESRTEDGEWSTFWMTIPSPWSSQLVSKGSITVNGVSLTVVDVARETFSVALIPHTLAVTNLGRLSVGDPVNLETDVLAKYVAQAVQHYFPNHAS